MRFQLEIFVCLLVSRHLLVLVFFLSAILDMPLHVLDCVPVATELTSQHLFVRVVFPLAPFEVLFQVGLVSGLVGTVRARDISITATVLSLLMQLQG